jgi:lipopolysaccharide transport system ATP-binding protein
MYVRLAFAVAAHLEPEILVIDEVLAVGDYRFQRKCMAKMDQVSHAGRTILFVSHNMGAIRSLCSRALLLRSGKLVLSGTTDEVIQTYLEDTVVRAASVSWEIDTTREAQFTRVTLKDASGKPSLRLDMLQPFSVEVEYLVHKDQSGIVVSCAIHTQLDDCLIATADHDLDRSRLESRGKGLHKTSVQFPGNLINSGTFNLVVGISIPGKVILDRREVLQFELFDSGSFIVNGGGEERRNALLLMGLRWT